MGQPYWFNRQNEETGTKFGVKVSINGKLLERVFRSKGEAIEYLGKQGYTKSEIKMAKFFNT